MSQPTRCTSIMLFVFLAMTMVLATSCSKSVEQRTTDVSELETETVMVKVQKVEPATFSAELVLTSDTAAFHDVTLSTQAAGKVESLLADTGSFVKSGAILAKIDSRLAKAQLDSALASYESAKASMDRQQVLFDKKLVASQNIETGVTQFKLAASQLRMAQIQYENLILKAPISGFITQKFVNEAEIVALGTPIFNLVDISKLKIVIGVSQSDLPQIRLHDPVMVRISALNLIVRGSISTIGVKANSKSKTFPVQIIVSNPGFRIKAGMIAEVTVTTKAIQNVIAIRQDYILERNGMKSVAVMEHGKAIIKSVSIGDRAGDLVRIISGLKSGEILIVENQRNVSEQQPVEVK